MSRIPTPVIEAATGPTADISLAMAVITFTNVFNRINDTELDYSAAA